MHVWSGVGAHSIIFHNATMHVGSVYCPNIEIFYYYRYSSKMERETERGVGGERSGGRYGDEWERASEAMWCGSYHHPLKTLVKHYSHALHSRDQFNCRCLVRLGGYALRTKKGFHWFVQYTCRLGAWVGDSFWNPKICVVLNKMKKVKWGRVDNPNPDANKNNWPAGEWLNTLDLCVQFKDSDSPIRGFRISIQWKFFPTIKAPFSFKIKK